MYDDELESDSAFDSTSDIPASDIPAPAPLFSPYAIVPGLFARRSINVIVGDSKTGRFKLALTNFNSYADPARSLFLDYPVQNPVRLGCILCFKDRDQTVNNFRAMGLDNLARTGTFPIMRWHSSDETEALHPLVGPYRALQMADPKQGRFHDIPPPNFILIENLQLLLSSGNSSGEKEVAVFLDLLRKFCNENDVTILATVGTPKTGVYSHCQRIKGTGLWADGVDTIISLEEVKGNPSNGLSREMAENYRKLTIIPPGQPRIRQWARFQMNGRLCLVREPEARMVTGPEMLYKLLGDEGEGKMFTRGDFMAWGTKSDVGERSVDRWIGECVAGGVLRREGHRGATRYVKVTGN